MFQDIDLEVAVTIARMVREAEALAAARIAARQLGEAFQPKESDHD